MHGLVIALAVLVVLVSANFAGAAMTSAKKGHLGGPPTYPLGPADDGTKGTPEIVICRGRLVVREFESHPPPA